MTRSRLRVSPDALRAARLEAGHNHTTAAAAIGRTASMVVGYESGRWTPSLEALLAMSAEYGVPVGELVEPADQSAA